MNTKRSIKLLNLFVIFLMLFSPMMQGVTPVTAQDRAAGMVELDGIVSIGTGDGVSSVSFAHTAGTGDDRLMLVGVSWNSGTDPHPITTAYFNDGSTDIPMSVVHSEMVNATSGAGGPRYAAILSLLAPPSGVAGTVIINFDGTVQYGIVATAVNFKDVDQATPLGTPQGANGDSSSEPSVSLSGLGGDELVFDTAFLGGSNDTYTLSVGADQSELWNEFNNYARSAGSIEQASSSSVTMSWTAPNPNWWALAAVPINPAASVPVIEAFALPSDSAPLVGDSIDVTVNINMDGAIAPDDYLGSFSASLSWNPAVLSYSSDSGVLSGYTGAVNPDTDHINFNGAKPSGDNGSIDVITVTLDVIGEGDAGLDLSFSAMAADTDESILAYLTIDDGSVIAEAPSSEVLPDGIASSIAATGETSIDLSHTTGTGENRMTLVGISWNSGTSERDISTVTFSYGAGPTVLSLVEVIDAQASSARNSAIYAFDGEPPQGEAGTITITFDGSVSSGIVAGAANFKNVDQVTPLGTPGSATASSLDSTLTLSGLEGDELVFDNLFQGASGETQTITVGADQTELWNAWIGNCRSGSSYEQAVSDSVTMTWTAQSSSVYVLTAVPLNPAPLPPEQHTITASAGANGSISPDGAVLVTDGDNQTFLISPASGFEIADVLVDSVSVGAVASYEFLNVVEDHTISASFQAIQYTITASAGANGSISPDGAILVDHGSNQTFSITASGGFQIEDVLVDSVSVGAVSSYEFVNVVEAHTISASFSELPPDQFTITASAGLNGSIDPSGAVLVTEGENQTFLISPSGGFEIADVLVDSVSVGAVASYEFINVVEDHTISASFQAIQHTITASAGSNGSIAPDGAVLVDEGANQSFAITPSGGFIVEDVLVDSLSVGAVESYEFVNVVEDHTISVSFIEEAVDSVVASAVPSDASPDVGDSITVTIHIDMTGMSEPDDLLGSFTSSLSWNPAILSYDSNSGLLEGFTGAINPGSGLIQFNGAKASGMAGSFDIFTVTFNVIGAGDAVLNLGFSAMAAETGNSIMDDLDIIQGSVMAEGEAGVVEMVSTSQGIGDGTDVMSFAHTTGTGANRLMLVGISWNSGDAAENIETVVFSYGATNLTLAEVITEEVTVSGSTSGPRFAAIYSLLNPPSNQAGTITITFDDDVSNGVVAGAATFRGVHQSVPLGTPVSNNGDSSSDPTVTLVGLTGNELVFDDVFLGGADDSYTLAVGPGQTEFWNDFDTNTRGTASVEQAAGNSVTMSWVPDTQNWWAQVAVPINPALGGVTYYDLTIAVNPTGAGTTNPAVGTYTYEEGAIVDISASPLSGFEFDEWSGACTGSGACQVTMSGNLSVTANFNTVTVPISFTGAELLGRPTDHSITIKIVPDEVIEYYYEYGLTSGSYTAQTSNAIASAGTPSTVVIDGLAADSEYFYRMQYSTDGGSTWVARSEYSFVTQRAEGSSFTFDITTDSHLNIVLGDPDNWEGTLEDVADDDPDFLIDLGDTFDIRSLNEGDVAGAENSYKYQLPFFNTISHSTPIYLVPGNHEQQEAWHLDGTANSLAVIGTNAQKKFYLNPVPDGDFYTGDESTYAQLAGDQYKEDYYSWEWGDALFVVISPYWYTTTKPYVSDLGGGEDDWDGSGDSWDWTLGLEQFEWLKDTLAGSDASYKFIIMHQLVLDGNFDNQTDYGHGGANYTHLYEWGGYNEDGTTWGWDTERPGWGSDPIHQVLLDNGVSAVFHAHDHQYAYEVRDGIVYQEVPSGGFDGNGFGEYVTGDGYTIQALENLGHIRVRVSPEETCVDYIHTGETSSAYTYCFEPAETHYDLTVSVDPAGSGTTNPVVGEHSYVEDDEVTITATPAVGYEFDHWSGDCSGDGVCQLTMDADKSVTAHFVLIQHTLSVAVDPSGAGTTNPTVGDHLYDYGSEVEITAQANAGYEFAYWSGDCTGSGICEVTMDGDMSVVANFARTTFALNVLVDPAEGGTTVPSAGIHQYLEDSEVAVIAEAAAGYEFDHWSGDCTGSGSCSVIMDADKTVTAHFAEITYDLTIIIDPAGGGSTTPAEGVHTYVIDSEVSVTPIPDSDYLFVEWTGDCTGTGPCELVMDGDKEVTAHFELKTFDLTIEVEPAESGMTDPAIGSHTYDVGTVVPIEPTPAAGFEFAYWSGDCTGTGACEVTISEDMYVMAHFAHRTYDLTIAVDPVEGGTTNPAPGVHPYLEGTPVVILAEPATGFEFDSWSGACTGSGPCSVTMDGNKLVTANFRAIMYDLTVNVAPEGGGTTTPAEGVHSYAIGTPVSVTAEPTAHYLFVEWTGDCTGSGACDLTMDGAKEVTANFELEEFDLTLSVDPVSAGTLDPAIGIHSYPYGSVVDVTPTPAAGYEFAYWTGDCSGTGSCQVTVDEDMDVQAHFMTATYDLTIIVSPTGSGTTSPSEGVHPYLHGTEVNIIPTPEDGYIFISWSGDCTGTGACVLVMDGEKTVTANFEEPKECFPLTITSTGEGALPIADPPNSDGCGVGEYEPDTVINLTASPESGWHVDSWYGTNNDSSTSESNVLTMPASIYEVGVNYMIFTFIPVIIK